MRTLWLFLLVLLWDPTSEAVELTDEVLASIVTSFRGVSGKEPSDTNGGGQFAFLMALTPDQCTGKQTVNFSPPGAGAAPKITGNPNNFLKIDKKLIPNYMAVYPNKGSRCSESKLLLLTQEDKDHWKTISAAQEFQDSINNRLTVGCVIFYTTYTPCTSHCFSNDQNCKILPALKDAPFNTNWKNMQKYFVYSEVYRSDKNKPAPVRNNLGEIAKAGFTIRKCDSDQNQKQNQNPIKCGPI